MTVCRSGRNAVAMSAVACALICLVLFVVPVHADLIADGSFAPGTAITPLTQSWSSAADTLGTWYTGTSSGDAPFWSLVEEGGESYVRPSVNSQIPRKLLQVIEGPAAGIREISFRYRISDDDDYYSVARLFGINADGDFQIALSDYLIALSGDATADVIYDQGGTDSYLPTATEWTSVVGNIDTDADYDYYAFYATFSYDGSDGPGNGFYADLDDVVVRTPEPGSCLLLLCGLAGIIARRREAA